MLRSIHIHWQRRTLTVRLAAVLGQAILAPATATASAASDSDFTPIRPATSPTTWITSSDYPAAALKERASGLVTFRVTVGVDGLPADCTIVTGSGSDVLDEAACTLVKARARFEPARDKAGKAVAGGYVNRVRWVLPKNNAPAPAPSSIEMSFVVGADGSVSDCKFVNVQGVGLEMIQYMTRYCEYPAYEPYVDKAGAPVARRVILRTAVSTEDVK